MDALVGKDVQSVLPAYGNPQLMGPLDDTHWLYGWLRPLTDPSLDQQNQQNAIQNRVFRMALEQVGMHVFTYHVEQDELRVLTPVAMMSEDQQVWKGGPELISDYLKFSEQDALFLADAFAGAAFGRSASLDVQYTKGNANAWLRITLSPIVRETGMIGSLVGTLQDITSLKLAEQNVSRNASFHNNVLSGISSAGN